MVNENNHRKVLHVETIYIKKILQDSFDKEVYDDAKGNYDITIKHPLDELLESHVIYGEKRGSFDMEFKDNLNHKYTRLTHKEIMSITYNKVFYFVNYCPKATARPKDTAHSCCLHVVR